MLTKDNDWKNDIDSKYFLYVIKIKKIKNKKYKSKSWNQNTRIMIDENDIEDI